VGRHHAKNQVEFAGLRAQTEQLPDQRFVLLNGSVLVAGKYQYRAFPFPLPLHANPDRSRALDPPESADRFIETGIGGMACKGGTGMVLEPIQGFHRKAKNDFRRITGLDQGHDRRGRNGRHQALGELVAGQEVVGDGGALDVSAVAPYRLGVRCG